MIRFSNANDAIYKLFYIVNDVLKQNILNLGSQSTNQIDFRHW
jgi:hypothetical protein